MSSVMLCGDVLCDVVEMIDFKLLWVLVTDERTDERSDICTSRVAFATENEIDLKNLLTQNATIRRKQRGNE